MNPPEEESNAAAIAWRVKTLEAQMLDLRKHIDERFDRLDGRMAQLTYVPVNLYESEKKSFEARIDSVEARTTWALGLIITFAIGVIVSGVGLVLSS